MNFHNVLTLWVWVCDLNLANYSAALPFHSDAQVFGVSFEQDQPLLLPV